MKIKEITGLKNLSSMGNETIKLSMLLENTIKSSVVLPAGISAGKYEAPNIPAQDALAEIESIKASLLEKDWEQETLDDYLVSLHLAGNTTLGISASFWKGTTILGQNVHFDTFPKLLMLLFEGGKHGNPALTIQEFMLIEESLSQAIADFKTMRAYLVAQKIESTVGAEGGFSPMNFTNQLVLEVIREVFPDRPLGLDAAGSFRSADADFPELFKRSTIYYLEDPYSDEQWEDWSKLTEQYGKEKLIVGDDLTVTNPERLQKAIDQKAIGGIIIKPNQNGTISGAMKTVKLAKENGLKVIVSHRGEETDDSWIVDFALSVKADYVKFGGMDRGERVAKYNRLLELGMK